jgi:hypothetical protein
MRDVVLIEEADRAAITVLVFAFALDEADGVGEG